MNADSPALPASARSPPHGLGAVADDWAAVEVWLRAIAGRARRNSPETVATYRSHLAKLRWFCEQVHGITPSCWTVQDVEAFQHFLEHLPEQALCARNVRTGAFARKGAAGYTPFRKRPAKSSRADILRCVHALFRAWREVGYIMINPMGLHGAGTVRAVNSGRALPPDLYAIVLEVMDAQDKPSFTARQLHARDSFLFIALRETGLRASELVKSDMAAFSRLSDPQQGVTYWIMEIREETAKGRRQRKIPVTKALLAALGPYREAFGLPPWPQDGEPHALVLSPRTSRAAVLSGGRPIPDVASRRFFLAWRAVRSRHGLYRIVKGRLASAADALEAAGDGVRAALLRRASPHWLRHTFAKGALLAGQDIRDVAAWLGHSDLGTTMVYTEQEALDLIRATNRAVPDLLARCQDLTASCAPDGGGPCSATTPYARARASCKLAAS